MIKELLEVVGLLTIVYLVTTIFAVIQALFTETMFEGESRLELAVLVAFTWPLALFECLRNNDND